MFASRGKAVKDTISVKLLLILAVMCCIAALILVNVRYEARKLQAELNRTAELNIELRAQNRRYQIELASFSDYAELHAQASGEHNMIFPSVDNGTLRSLAPEYTR